MNIMLRPFLFGSIESGGDLKAKINMRIPLFSGFRVVNLTRQRITRNH